MTGSSSRYVEHAAVITGPGASLLSRLLQAPQVLAFIRTAKWLHGDDFGQAVRAVHTAGRTWETSIGLRERNNAIRYELPGPNRATLSVEEASEHLGIGKRQVQNLVRAGRIAGHRLGGRWALDPTSVKIYQQKRAP
jgi:excisionase family DNA binding protein